MATTAREDISTTKREAIASKGIVFAPRAIHFAHQFVGAEQSLNLLALVTPTLLAGNGFVNATPQEMASANLAIFGKNLKLALSRNLELKPFVHYLIVNSNIVFIGGVSPLAGEILFGEIQMASGNAQIVGDVRFITGTVEVALGQTLVSIGDRFKINQNPSSQIGDVKINRNGSRIYRNVGNATAGPLADGNYQEVDAGGGFGVSIILNAAPVGTPDLIEYEIGVKLASGDLALWDSFQKLQGSVLSLAKDSAQGFYGDQDFTRYLATSPSDLERKAFGETVASNLLRIAALETVTELSVDIPGFATSASNAYVDVTGSTLVVPGGLWDLHFQGNVSVGNAAGGTSNAFVNMAILNAANEIVDNAISLSGGSTPAAGLFNIFHVALTARRVPPGTYRLAIRQNAANLAQVGGNDYTGSLTGIDSRNIFYARKIGK